MVLDQSMPEYPARDSIPRLPNIFAKNFSMYDTHTGKGF